MDGSREAEAVTRVVFDGSIFVIRAMGTGLLVLLNIISAAEKADKNSPGKKSMKAMLKSGKELSVFTFKEDKLKSFVTEAKKYGLQYCVIKRSDIDKEAGTYDVVCKAEDAARLNRVLEKIGVTRVDVNAQGEEVSDDKSNDNQEQEGEEEQHFNSNVSSERDLMDMMLKPANPEQAAEEETTQSSRSAASYQKEADIEPERRTSVKADISSINENIEKLQPEPEKNAEKELIANMMQMFSPAESNKKDKRGKDELDNAVNAMAEAFNDFIGGLNGNHENNVMGRGE